MKKMIIAVVLLMMAQQVFAAEGIGGVISFDYATDIKKLETYRRDIKLDLIFNYVQDNTQLKAALIAEDDSVRLLDASRIYLKEAYISQDLYFNSFINSLNFKIGRIIYTWGNADEMKPTDILNPQDLSYLMFKQIQDRKYGVWSGVLTVYITEDIFLETIALEEFKPNELESSRVFTFSQLEAMKAMASAVVLQLPDSNNLSKIKFAARLGAVLFDVDAHLLWYMGYDHMPSFGVSFPSMVVTQAYKEIQMIGMDFQRALFSGISIRGEAAYFIKGKMFNITNAGFNPYDPAASPLGMNFIAGGNGLLEKHYCDVTAGFDVMNMFTDKLYMNLQWNGNFIADYNADLKQEQAVNSILGTLEYALFDERLKPKLRGFYNINDNAFVFGAELAWRAGPSYEVKGGVWIFDGPQDSYYGQFRGRDMIFVSGKAEF
jgi:hypothetical protein